MNILLLGVKRSYNIGYMNYGIGVKDIRRIYNSNPIYFEMLSEFDRFDSE